MSLSLDFSVSLLSFNYFPLLTSFWLEVIDWCSIRFRFNFLTGQRRRVQCTLSYIRREKGPSFSLLVIMKTWSLYCLVLPQYLHRWDQLHRTTARISYFSHIAKQWLSNSIISSIIINCNISEMKNLSSLVDHCDYWKIQCLQRQEKHIYFSFYLSIFQNN